MATTTTRKPRKAVSPAERERRAAEKAELAKQLHSQLTEQAKVLASSDGWLRYLKYATSFHQYSFANIMLLLAQGVELGEGVAGFRQWQAKGRQVRKGERAKKIYGFAQKWVDDDTAPEGRRKVTYFPILSVFSESQTDPIEGHEQPAHPLRLLDGADSIGIYDAAKAFIEARGWTVERERISGGANGYTTIDGTKRIVVRHGVSDAQAAKTLLHECGHALIDADDDGQAVPGDRALSELQAESVAFIVAGVLGMDTSAYSVAYLTDWSNGDPKLLEASATRALAAAKVILSVLDPDLTAEADALDDASE